MQRILKQGRTPGRGHNRTLVLVALAVMSVGACAVAGPALAKKFTGTKRGDKISGTKGADKIKGKGGNDKIKGKGGNDALAGGKGRDKIVGGAGVDRLLGGPGNDTLKAADGRKDVAINGGGGRDRCIVDTALELSVVTGCEQVIAGGPGAGGTGPGPGEGLRVQSFTGLVGCTQQSLPLCLYTITGDGADALIGTVTGVGGVTSVGGGGNVTVSGSSWTVAGGYACTSDGFLRVTIGSETVDVPVDCAS
jgi:hypothetical protein